MKIISLPRRAGKTTVAIKESAKTGKYILVLNKQQARSLFTQSQKLGLNIPFPITLDKILDNKSLWVKEIIVDEAGIILEHLLGRNITMITITEEESG